MSDDVRTALAHARAAQDDAAAAIEYATAAGRRCQWVADILETHVKTCGQRPSKQDSVVTRRGNPRVAKDSVAMFLDRVDRGDEVAKAVLSLVEENGISVNTSSAGPHVRCTPLLERMYLQDPMLLGRSLRTVVRAWDRHPASLRGDVFEGVAMFYVDNADADEDHLVTVLRTLAVQDMLRRTAGNGRRRKMAELFADLYTSHQTLF